MVIKPDSLNLEPRPTVLVVEDEALIAEDLETMLQQHGWRVLGPVPTIAEALCLVEFETPDVALLDVDLRGEMITPVAALLRSLEVPFVLSSSCSRADLKEIDLLAEAPNVRKPAPEHRLVDALAKATKHHS